MSTLRRRWRAFACVTLIGLAAMALGVALSPSRYEARATLYAPVAGGSSSSTGVTRDDLQYADRLVNTYERITDSRALRVEVDRRVASGEDLEFELVPEPNSELMRMVGRASTAEDARLVANAAASALIDRVAEITRRSGVRERLTRQLDVMRADIRRLADAVPPESDPEHPTAQARLRQATFEQQELSKRLAELNADALAGSAVSISEPADHAERASAGASGQLLLLGVLLALAAGAGVAFVRDARAPQLERVQEVERVTGRPVLGVLPRFKRAPDTWPPEPDVTDAFGYLQARLLSATHETAARRMLITSTTDGAGKSFVAVNVAAAFANAGHRVLLVDASLGTRGMAQVLGVAESPGLAEFLHGEETSLGPESMPTKIQGVDLVPAGSTSAPITSSVLASPRMQALIERAAAAYDRVIIESRGLTTADDAAVLAPLVASVVVVVPRLPADRHGLETAVEDLESLTDGSVYLVVNRVRDRTRR